ncbi:MAG: RagB/SusD family nutrient uptake outer membrane protein [Balneolaceae bacterium]|nr:MAG: RagB/SusD family nutrient uptake outer membrane protein [Balneolaceae bacterium]
MIMKKLKILLVAVLAFAYIGCESEMNLSPFDSIDAETAYQTVSDLNSGALGAYGTISGQNIYEINALMTDNLRRASSNTGQGMQLFNHNLVSGDNTAAAVWQNAYVAIDRINRVIEASDNIEPATNDEVDLLNRIRGEMFGLRAWQHFDMFRTFASYDLSGSDLAVPYMLQSEIGKPARATKDEFFNLLLSDIDQAISLLGPSGFHSNRRLNLHAVEGLRARVALYRQDWPTAIEYASRVIDVLNLTPYDEYAGLWDDSNQGEVIFKLPRATASDGVIELTERATNPDIFFFASNDIVNHFDTEGDIRFQTWFQILEPGRVRVMKYNQRPGQKNVADIKMLRVSEMYFIRAEAHAQPGTQQNLEAAASDINSIKEVRYQNPEMVTFSSSEQALAEIHTEKRLEFVYEGHRYFDLKRAGLPVQRISEDIDGATTSDNLPANSHMFVFPIPQAEMFANENMIQNQGYE